MEIFGTQVITPYDDDFPENADWRNTIALLWADHPNWHPEVPEIREDKWIIEHKDFFLHFRAYGAKNLNSPKWRAHKRVLAWHGGETINALKFRLEPLLLTGASFELIAEDLGGSRLTAHEIELYCRLFFDLREEDGALLRSCFIRAYNALPDTGLMGADTPLDMLWKTTGMYLGYGGLIYMWKWPIDPKTLGGEKFLFQEMMRAAQAMQMERIMRSQISNFDLNAIIGNYTNYERMLSDTGTKTQEAGEAELAMLGVMKLVAPKMLPAAKTVDKQRAETAAIQSRLMADHNIAQQMIMDAGQLKGKEQVDEMLKQRLSNKK